eukprot:Clim_evm56s153 gene=Clim_evmTU56s153
MEYSTATEPQDWMSNEVMTGTTIMAVEFADGVVIGADSRTSMGSYVANRVSDKLTHITDNIYCCRSGSAADTQALADMVRYYLSMHSIELGEAPLVKTAASMFRLLCYNNRERLTAGIICAGWDPENGGSVYNIPLGGMWVRQPFAIGGSGSGYIYGFCDANYKKDMSKEECLEFVRNAVSLAMHRDGSSGGIIRQAVITKDGVERLTTLGNELPKWHSN